MQDDSGAEKAGAPALHPGSAGDAPTCAFCDTRGSVEPADVDRWFCTGCARTFTGADLAARSSTVDWMRAPQNMRGFVGASDIDY